MDSADAERMHEAREELMAVLEDPELRDAIVLVYANKQDLPGALSASDVAERLKLSSLRHTW